MNKTLKLPFLFVFFIFLFFSCCEECDKGEKCEELTFENIKFKGIVSLRAETDHNIGLIKLLPYKDEKELESPNRGIIYKYDTTQVFDLGDIVSFSVNCDNNFQYADEIVLSDNLHLNPDEREADAQDLFLAMKHFQLNFHNADLHREGPQHKLWHIKPGSRVVNQQLSNGGYIALTIEIISPAEEKQIYFDDSEMPGDPSSDIFINERDPNTPLYFSPDSFYYHHIYTSHEHAH